MKKMDLVVVIAEHLMQTLRISKL